MTTKPMPLCWDNQQNWAEWNRLNELWHSYGGTLDHFCADCLPEYKERMIGEDRCAHAADPLPEATQPVVFVRRRRLVKPRSADPRATWLAPLGGNDEETTDL